MNNPTKRDSYTFMLGRADIEESKSYVALFARQQQASYPYGNFSVTNSLKLSMNGSFVQAFAYILNMLAKFCI